MSWMKVDGAGWSWMELMELGEGGCTVSTTQL